MSRELVLERLVILVTLYAIVSDVFALFLQPFAFCTNCIKIVAHAAVKPETVWLVICAEFDIGIIPSHATKPTKVSEECYVKYRVLMALGWNGQDDLEGGSM